MTLPLLASAAQAAGAAAEGPLSLLWLTVALPLAGSLANGLIAIRWPRAKSAVSLIGPAVLIDQTFALASALPADVAGARFRRYWWTAGATMFVGWLGSHLVGVDAGPLLPAWLPLDITAPAVLVGLLVPHLKRRSGAVAAVGSGVVAAAASTLPTGVGTLLGALAGLLAASVVGALVRGRRVAA